MMHEFSALDGAILIDKPAGPTSHDVVDAVRRHFGIKKVGHCGTLDPNATGLLVLLLGRGTKLSDKLMADDKVYEGTIKFGESTDSYDADGRLVASLPVMPMTLEQLNEAAAQFVGDLMQTPPMVSAVKKGGVPLYKLARKGIEVEREARLVHIYSLPLCRLPGAAWAIPHWLHQRHLCAKHRPGIGPESSGAAPIWPASAVSFPGGSMSPRPPLWPKSSALTTRELEKLVIPFLKLAGG